MKVKRWWLARRLIGKHILMDAGKLAHVDYWDMDAYTDEDWIGGPFYINMWTFIEAIFTKPQLDRKPWEK